ncbi:MAG: hypothetical protein R3300_19485 [Candidatus Promineifilaceae bacterium]|nr:hypothetical protein [Candidatus Promineifilaceae bacterium]
MRRVILQTPNHVHPFNEAARDLRVRNVPLWLWQHDLLGPLITSEREYPDLATARRLETERTETLAHRDNLFFNQALLEEFLNRARNGGGPAQLALDPQDPAVAQHVRPLSESLTEAHGLLLVEMWYLPDGVAQIDRAEPLLVNSESREVGYYHVPPYMATMTGDLVFQLPRKSVIALDSWVHLFVIDILFGVFARGKDMEDSIALDWRKRLRILLSAMVEQKRVLDTSALVSVGRNCVIDPTAVIHGPTTIGDNVTIGPGAVIDNCIIGNNVNISQGCQLMLSVVSDGCFLPFRAALFMSTLMENTMVAQNTCLQMCVVGRDTFIGAGTTFTDFKLLPGKLAAARGSGDLQAVDLLVLGGCVGHHCRLSSGLIIYPARTVESDVVLLAEQGGQFITRDIRFEDSAHHRLVLAEPYPRLYPRRQHGPAATAPPTATDTDRG